MMQALPQPDAAAIRHSTALCAYMLESKQGQDLSFSEFMQQALYAPELGYYSAGLQKFGSGGDFVTAPELSPMFGQCLANVCAQILPTLAQGQILEFGAGSGRLAVDVLQHLDKQYQLQPDYYILELSADLRARQQALFEQHAPEYLPRVHWLDRLPAEPIQALVLANEVLDAMPVERFIIEAGTMLSLAAHWQGQRFEWRTQAPADLLSEAVQAKQDQLDAALPSGYCSEINLYLKPWLQALAASLDQGLVLLIDYGQDQSHYYHPQRQQGTLMCHYRHYAHSDPFFYPGLQDITADVDFSALAQAASAAGFEVAGYTQQAEFLLNSGLPQLLEQALATQAYPDFLHSSQRAKQLILPQAMGERFKIMALQRGVIGDSILGFEQDRRYML